MYSFIHETDSATAVTHSLRGRLLNSNVPQLVTVCMKTLRIYRINENARYVDDESHDWQEGARLECLYKIDLLAPVRSIAVVRAPLCPLVDSLILAFDETKISVINFDNSSNSLQTTSLHDFEDEELRDGFTKQTTFPLVRVDPAQRCAAILVYNRHLAILPLNDTTQGLHSYTFSLASIDPKLDNVVDMIFLHGYYEPTLFIVYEPIQTTAGRCIFVFYHL